MLSVDKKEIPVKDLTDGFKEKGEMGVLGFGGALNIRPPYQREFIYNDKQQVAVINSILRGMPLNIMYWAVSEDGKSYEVLDGQQRTMSICRFVNGDFPIPVDTVQGLQDTYQYFSDLSEESRNKILDYKLDVYLCEGSNEEKLKWFGVINIAGEKLTTQELRNAVYTGPWLADAKKYFSHASCPAKKLGKDYVEGSTIRQELLEKAIKWASTEKVETYMRDHRHDSDAHALWVNYSEVLNWAKQTFPEPRPKLMKHVDWGALYKACGGKRFDSVGLESRILELLDDEEVTKQYGIYDYLITGDERKLSLRAFSDKLKVRVHSRQDGVCVHCGERFALEEMEADHIIPWSKGGKTVEDNCQMLCKKCNGKKSNK